MPDSDSYHRLLGWMERNQDEYIATIQIIFAVLLAPTILSQSSVVPLWSSIPTALLLYGLAVTYRTMGLRISPLATVVTATAWLLIAVVRHP